MLTTLRPPMAPPIVQAPYIPPVAAQLTSESRPEAPAAASSRAEPEVRETAVSEPYIERGTQRRLPWETGNVAPGAPVTVQTPTPTPSPPSLPSPRPGTTHTVWSGAGNSNGENREPGND